MEEITKCNHWVVASFKRQIFNNMGINYISKGGWNLQGYIHEMYKEWYNWNLFPTCLFYHESNFWLLSPARYNPNNCLPIGSRKYQNKEVWKTICTSMTRVRGGRGGIYSSYNLLQYKGSKKREASVTQWCDLTKNCLILIIGHFFKKYNSSPCYWKFVP